MPDKKKDIISLVKKVYRGIHKVLPIFDRYGAYCYMRFEKECRRYNSRELDTYVKICFPQFRKTVFRREDISKSIRMPFEFTDIPVPVGYDRILNQLYGDYHQIVQGGTAHSKTNFDTNRDYKSVLREKYGNKKYGEDKE